MRERSDDRLRVWALTFVGVVVVVSVVVSFLSIGFLEADGVTHYLYARFAFDRPRWFVDVWGRPAATLLYSVPAQLGVPAARLASLGCLLIAAACAGGLAKGQGRRPWLAVMFTLASPMAILHASAVLTELPFAALLVAALLAYQRRVFWLCGLLTGVLPLARPEGFGMIVCGALLLLLTEPGKGRWVGRLAGAGLCFLPLVLWITAGRTLDGWWSPWWRAWLVWLPDNWPYSGESVYSAGNVWKFALSLPVLVGPALVAPMLIGWWQVLRRPSVKVHAGRVDLLIVLVPLGFLFVHSVLHATGKLASSGDVRYLTTVVPLLAISAGRGWEVLADRLRVFARPAIVVAAAALGVVMLVKPVPYGVMPFKREADSLAAERVAAWWEHGAHGRSKLIAPHPEVSLYVDRLPRLDTADYRQAPPDAVLVWDNIYGRFNADARLTTSLEILENAGWREVEIPELQLPEGWHVFFSNASTSTLPADLPLEPAMGESVSPSN